MSSNQANPGIPAGFVLAEERVLPELEAAGSLYRHVTGAEVLSLRHDDPNRVFGIAFRTPPADSTGVAHILEHSVLCGSERYPVRKPFVELLKGSLHTFLNAMTFPDMTCYALASTNEQDFRNLLGVYLDAVFFPTLAADTFRQEAWRIEPAPGDAFALQGIVYNEMKGGFSSPREVLSETLRRALFPDTVYGFGYGGDPAEIPELTVEAMRAFHRRFYSPANAFVFCSGRHDPAGCLEAVGACLERAPAGDPAPAVAPQPASAMPRRVEATYPAVREEDRRDGFVAMGWALDAGMDRPMRVAWKVLDRFLVGSPTAPLRRALVEAGYGEDLVESGFSEETLQPVFRVGLSGADPGRAEVIEAAVLETLRHCAERLDLDEVAAALNIVEFRLREGSTGPVPAGIRHMLDAMRTWRYGGDPFANLRFEAELGALRELIAAGEPVLQRLIGALVQDRHRVTLVLQADPSQSSREADLERRRVEAVLAGMGEGAADRAAKEAQALREGQDRSERPEALASIPVLELADLPREVERDPVEVGRTHPLLLIQDLPAKGILYLDVGLDLAGLPFELLPHARLLGAVLPKTATARRDRLAMARRIDSSTGGITARAWAAGSVAGGHAARLFLRGKALAAEAGQLAAIVEEILLEAKLEPVRLREIVLEEKARTEAALVPSGHEFVDRRIRANLSAAGRAEEKLNGTDYLQFLRRQASRGDFEALSGELDVLRAHLLGRGLLIGLAADGDTRAKAAVAVDALCAALDLPEAPPPPVRDTTPAPVEAEALEVFSQVNFVGLGVDVYAGGLAPSGATDAAVRHLSNVWLWDKVRVRGGAYGGLARIDPADGILTQLSYRDPNLLETFDVFRGAAEFLLRPPSPRDLRSATVAAVGLLDRPLPPALRTLQVLQRWLAGQRFEWRAVRRADLLGARAADFRRLGEAIRAGAETAVAMGGASALDAAEALRPGWLRRSRLV